MEGAPEADGSAFKECLALSNNNPYVLRLAFSAGIGGLLFGYDTVMQVLYLVLFCILEMISKKLTERLGFRCTLLCWAYYHGINDIPSLHFRGCSNQNSMSPCDWNTEVDVRNSSSACWIATYSHVVSPRITTLVGREEEGKQIMRKIYSDGEAEAEIQNLSVSTEMEKRELESAVMYYSSTIVQLAGFASNETALLLSLITAAVNAIGAILSIYYNLGHVGSMVTQQSNIAVHNTGIGTQKDVQAKLDGLQVGLALYILFFSPGMGSVPWIIN
ncbi:hypothetical protein VNO77_01418 [Canavalia gladiata]|uniref:Uncharacterized protein n=1 Tax=Canavalia gladiata TaxID=3824 RepID=A0AAN9MW10_CANGL